MEIKTCRTCGKMFLIDSKSSYCRICSKKWNKEQKRLREEEENRQWREQRKTDRELFETEIEPYNPIPIDSVIPSNHTLYIVGNGFDLMHRVPSSYYSFRDSLGKRNGLRDSLETALTADDIWADFENALGILNLDLMGSRHIVDMWLDDFGFYNDEDAGDAEYYMAIEAAASPIINLVNELHPAFRRWINSLEIGTDDRPLVHLFKTDGKVLDFNYTEFVETLYGTHNVCYIHGCRKNKKEKLILGHKPDFEASFHEKERKPHNYRQAVVDVAQDNVFELIGQYDEELTKNSHEIIKSKQTFFNDLKDIDQIIVIGHSISKVDWDYFVEIDKNTEDAHWYFGIFGLNDFRNMLDLVGTLGIEKYRIFRTDSISTKPNKVGVEKSNVIKEPKPRILKHDDTVVTLNETYDLIIDEEFELILPNHVKRIVFLDKYILITIDDLDKSILLFGRQNDTWAFINRLESFEHQGLINRRLNHVFHENHMLTFVYNSRIRKYDLTTGKMIFNQQVRDAKSKEYLGVDVMKRFLGG